MSDKNKPIWYFRFTNDFFNQDMANMENLPMYGDKFIVTLLKLYTLSLEKGGVIVYERREPEETYTMWLARICGVDMKTMSMAISYYVSHGFLEIHEEMNSVEVHAPYVKRNTGKTSVGSEERRMRRLRSKEQEALPKPATAALPAGEPAEEKKLYGILKNVMLTESEYAALNDRYSNADYVIDELSTYYALKENRYNSDYAGVLKFGKEHGKLREADSEKSLKRIEMWEREARAGFEPPEEAREVLSAEEFERISELAKKG